MKTIVSVSKLHEEKKHKSENDDFIADPQKALDILERLRIESGKFIYEYPVGFRRVIEVIRET